ncbi:MAG: ATP-binding protein [Bacteroidia bacterium]
MKINRIDIKDFRQFKDLSIDLTYPEGHIKAGQPLDKVCFIGQSGTGKTTILDLIRFYTQAFSNNSNSIIEIPLSISGNIKIDYLYEGKIFTARQEELSPQTRTTILGLLRPVTNNPDISLARSIVKTILYYFPAEILWSFEKFGKINLKQADKGEYSQEYIREIVEKLQKTEVIDFSSIPPVEVWYYILKDLLDHREQETQKRLAISNIAENLNVSPEAIQQKVEELNEWRKKNPSPINSLADALDPIIKDFKVKIKRELDFKSTKDLFTIQLQTFEGTDIDTNFWSTGTKQVILTAIPLIKLPTEDRIVLIDEPERSLYPDKQAEIINFYTRIAPEAQFFFATHSPIVASSFEPWEIVELKFNETGKVYREVYFSGENHIDNYTIDPRYYKYGTVLKNIFDMKIEGGDSDFRNKAQMRASYLADQIKELNRVGKVSEAQALYPEYKDLAEKLDWELAD